MVLPGLTPRTSISGSAAPASPSPTNRPGDMPPLYSLSPRRVHPAPTAKLSGFPYASSPQAPHPPLASPSPSSLSHLVANPSAVPGDPLVPNGPMSHEAMYYANAGRIEAKWATARSLFHITLVAYLVTFVADIFIFPLAPGPFGFISKIVRPFNLMLTLATVLQFFNVFWENNVRPSAFGKVADAVSKLTPQQRELFNVDPNIARLVDAVHPTVPSKCTKPTHSITQHPTTPPVRNMTRIQLCPPVPAPKITAYVPSTSDVRYAQANSIFGGDKTAGSTPFPQTSPTASAGPPLNIPLKPMFQTYQQSAVPTAEEQKVAGGDQMALVGPDDTLRLFATNATELSVWVENLREWLSTKIFVPLVADMAKVEQYLDKKGWSNLSLRNYVQAVDAVPGAPASTSTFSGPSSKFGFGTNPSTFSSSAFGQSGFGSGLSSNFMANLTGPPTSLNSLAQQAANEPLARLRIQLERYLYMRQYPATARTYIMRRILELSMGRALAKFVWNAGGEQDDGKPWVPLTLPTDAELVLHVFATWIDLQMPGAFSAVTYAPFSTKYVRWTLDEKKDDLPSQWTVVMSQQTPPHFKLGFQKTLYDVYPKRNNMFATIALFTHKVHTECSSYIDMLDIGGKVIGLTDILSNIDY